MRILELSSGEWRSGQVLLAETFWERLRGLLARPSDTAMLIPGSSVHGFGMRRSCRVIALDPGLGVLSTSILRPGRIVWQQGAAWMLELPVTVPPPPAGGDSVGLAVNR